MSSNNEISNQINSQNYTLYKPSKYLKMPRRLLLHSLHLQLNCPLKKKKEQRFILSRLKIIDQQFCLEQIRYLYQTYFDLGLQQQVWPVSFNIILLYVHASNCFILRMIFFKLYNQMNLILFRNIWQIICYYYKTKSINYTTELLTQSSTCPSTLLPLEIIDQRLKEFVRLHHLDLLRTINYQISKLNSNILIKKFSKQLSTFHLTTKQV